jgi:hypothetical protein
LALFPVALGLGAPDPAGAQGRWIDIGANQSYQIGVEGDPLSYEHFPSMAFGPFAPGNLVYAELLAWPCASLPDQSPCGEEGRLVASFHGYLDTGTCPCQGLLFEPATIQFHYDPSRVQGLGGREEALRIKRFDVDQARWVDLDAQVVDTTQDVVRGRLLGHARQYYVVVLGESPQDEASWGRIKAHWSEL